MRPTFCHRRRRCNLLSLHSHDKMHTSACNIRWWRRKKRDSCLLCMTLISNINSTIDSTITFIKAKKNQLNCALMMIYIGGLNVIVISVIGQLVCERVFFSCANVQVLRSSKICLSLFAIDWTDDRIVLVFLLLLLFCSMDFMNWFPFRFTIHSRVSNLNWV